LENPLLSPFDTPFESAPFDQIKYEHYVPAIEQNIAQALEEVQAIAQQSAAPTFENTLEALEDCGAQLGRNTSLLFNLNSAATSTELQQLAQKLAPQLAAFQNSIRSNTVLFERIEHVYKNTDRHRLNPEQITLLEKEYKGFVRNGARLTQTEKEQLKTLDTRLAQCSLSFGEHTLADTHAFELLIEDLDQLKGLPENNLHQAAETAKERGKEGWVFTLDYPSYVPFMTYVENRELRQKMSLAYGKIGFQQNENNNETIIQEIVHLRQERASLLGYSSHAAYVLEERMAQDEATVVSFLNHLQEKARPSAEREWKALEALAKGYNCYPIEKWDTAFLTEKLKQQELELDDQALRAYFPLEQTLQGLFTVAKRLFQIEFEPLENVAPYHKEVSVYKVSKINGKFMALLYLDFYPRESKRSGAWMTSYRSQKGSERPHVSIVCNFSKPTKDTPSLLTFNEVTTLFHEFGHALHGMLADTQYSGLSGTHVFWDFVELPSQIMENWCYQKEALHLFAKHYQTQALLPEHYLDKIQKVAQFQQGLQTLRQLSFAQLDLAYHTQQKHPITDIKAHEKAVMAPFSFTPDHDENCLSTNFSHIFQGGYAAGYYSYKWAEVLDADAFDLFLEKGIFDSATAQAFEKHILSKGGTEHPMELYNRFRQKAPNPDALLKRAGLLV